MNYARKKYQLESKWVAKKIKPSVNFLLLVHLKSCNAFDRVKLQKDFVKFNLKIRLLSIRKFDSSLFSKLSKDFKTALLRGQSAIILNEGIVTISKIVSILKTFTTVSPLLVYAYSRFLNYSPTDTSNRFEIVSSLEWGSILNRFNSSSEIFNVVLAYYFNCFSLFKIQHFTILNLLIKRL
jgi:hypothetical protein